MILKCFRKSVTIWSLILTLCLGVCYLSPISMVKASNASEIQAALDEIKTKSGYIPGKTGFTTNCKTFVNSLASQLFGYTLPSTASNEYQYINYSGTFTQLGSLSVSAGNLTSTSLQQLFAKAQPGDVVQMDYTNYSGNDSLHTMMVYSASSSGVVFYHAGKSGVYFGRKTTGNDILYGTSGQEMTYAELLRYLGDTDDGISLYRSKTININISSGGSSSGGTSSGTDAYSSTNPNDYTVPTVTLKYTSPTTKGSHVAWVQAVLYQLGYTITIDGSYGSASETVVKQFQQDYGLEVDGMVGPNTRAKLIALWESKSTVYMLDLNGCINGTYATNISGYGTADVYVNGTLVSAGCNDFYTGYPVGTTYEVKNVKAADGYRFVGAKGNNLTGTIGVSGVSVELMFSSVYAIRYNANGGSMPVAFQEKLHGSSTTLISVIPQKNGFTFMGWGTNPTDEQPIYFSGGQYSVNQSVTLYGVWKQTGTVEEALLALQASTQKILLTTPQTSSLDVNGDGDVTVIDALLILQYATKKITTYPQV